MKTIPFSRPILCRSTMLTLAAIATVSTGGLARAGGVERREGPAGSTILVEESHTLPLVTFALAARPGAVMDPIRKEGLTNLAIEVARRGAGGKDRQALDAAFDDLGASLHVTTTHGAVRLEGHVLSRHLDQFLALVADIVLRPTFDPEEIDRTRRELQADLDEARNDDHAVCARYFRRNAYGDAHPYGRSPVGRRASLAAIPRSALPARHRALFSGQNLIFAAAGDVSADGFASKLAQAFGDLPPGKRALAPSLRRPQTPRGWRIQLVDRPDRQQTQIMIGRAVLPVTDPDFLALDVALTAFGGTAMQATLMDEVRSKRGLAYGAYMDIVPARGPSLLMGSVMTGTDNTVETLRLVLKLLQNFADKGISAKRLRFFQDHIVGNWATEMDSPASRLYARLRAELAGLPDDWVDTYLDRVTALTAEQIREALAKHLTVKNLAITMVATAGVMKPLLLQSGIKDGSIDVVSYDNPKY